MAAGYIKRTGAAMLHGRRLPAWLLSCCLLALAAPQSSGQGRLDSFEKNLERTQSGHSSKSGRQHDHDDDRACTCLGDFFFDVLSSIFSSSGGSAAAGGTPDPDDSRGGGGSMPVADRTGDLLAPAFRADIFYQRVEPDIDAPGCYLLAGVGPLAASLDIVRYREGGNGDKLSIFQLCGVFRFPLDRHFEVDFGAGCLGISGDHWNGGIGVTVPMIFQVNDQLGAEVRPMFGDINDREISIVDAAIIGGTGGWSVRAGYRWVETHKESLNGPCFGLGFRW
ncbi:MAG: hypothetical protein C0404_00215 [Verrucomicrobia bacterium]|nr:hypothetical protein [Verrucomicrobiota bacterium]